MLHSPKAKSILGRLFQPLTQINPTRLLENLLLLANGKSARRTPVSRSRVCHGRVDVVEVCVTLAGAQRGDGPPNSVKHRIRQLPHEGAIGLVVDHEDCRHVEQV